MQSKPKSSTSETLSFRLHILAAAPARYHILFLTFPEFELDLPLSRGKLISGKVERDAPPHEGVAVGSGRLRALGRMLARSWMLSAPTESKR
jgi:hypothetical protein